MIVKLPERGDVIRVVNCFAEPLYKVILRTIPERGPLCFRAITMFPAGGSLVSYNNLSLREWCYADPNREDHADIPEAICDLRRQVLTGEVG